MDGNRRQPVRHSAQAPRPPMAAQKDVAGNAPYIGNRKRATQPGPSRRFSSVNAPPWPSAIWRLSTSPMPLPPGLVVKNGTKGLAVLERPGPSSLTQISSMVSRCQPTVTRPLVVRDASAALRRRLISTCSSRSGSTRMVKAGPLSTCTGRRVSKLAARPTQSASERGCNRSPRPIHQFVVLFAARGIGCPQGDFGQRGFPSPRNATRRERGRLILSYLYKRRH